MAGFWTVVYKQFLDERMQWVRDELITTKLSLTKCTLVDELLRLESAVEIKRTDMFERVICSNKKPVTCEKTPSKKFRKNIRKKRKQTQNHWVAR